MYYSRLPLSLMLQHFMPPWSHASSEVTEIHLIQIHLFFLFFFSFPLSTSCTEHLNQLCLCKGKQLTVISPSRTCFWINILGLGTTLFSTNQILRFGVDLQHAYQHSYDPSEFSGRLWLGMGFNEVNFTIPVCTIKTGRVLLLHF